MGPLDKTRDTDEVSDTSRELGRWLGGSSRDLFDDMVAERPKSSDQQMDISEARKAVEQAYSIGESLDSEHGDLPVSNEDISERTTANRINLADNVPWVARVPERGGYLDVVMHGDAQGTQADIDGIPINFTLEDTAQMVRECPAWGQRPIRLMSCTTGEGNFGQELADSLRVPVYAPTDRLQVRDDGTTYIHKNGSWKRFEPML